MRAQPIEPDSLPSDDALRGATSARGWLSEEVAMSAEPSYRIPMPPGGEWTDEYLDALRADVHYRTEIVDGNLVVSPKPHPWHADVMREVTNNLVAAAPPDSWAYGDIELRWYDGKVVRRSLAPDVTVAPRTARGGAKPFVRPGEVQLVVEVVSPGSVITDREHKPRFYATGGIPAMWRIERGVTLTEYRLTVEGGPEIVRTAHGGKFTTDVPFPVSIDLDALR